MALPRNPKLTTNARSLRGEMTKEERRLWYHFLRSHPVKFYRQRVVGNYILDFYAVKAKLAIELDGSQHYTEEGQLTDITRTAFLNRLGIEVMRFSNPDVLNNFEGVCIAIEHKLQERL